MTSLGFSRFSDSVDALLFGKVVEKLRDEDAKQEVSGAQLVAQGFGQDLSANIVSCIVAKGA